MYECLYASNALTSHDLSRLNAHLLPSHGPSFRICAPPSTWISSPKNIGHLCEGGVGKAEVQGVEKGRRTDAKPVR